MLEVPPFDPCILVARESQCGVGFVTAPAPILVALLLIALSLGAICTIVLILRPLFVYLLSEETFNEAR